MIVGCVVAALGILLARHYLDRAAFVHAAVVVLAVAGLGFGIAVVPLTAAVLGYVPAAHSGMAASATNTAGRSAPWSAWRRSAPWSTHT